MMNCLYDMVDRRKKFSLTFIPDHCQGSSPSWISGTLQTVFEHARNLSSGLLESSCDSVSSDSLSGLPRCCRVLWNRFCPFVRSCIYPPVTSFLGIRSLVLNALRNVQGHELLLGNRFVPTQATTESCLCFEKELFSEDNLPTKI